MFFKQIENYKSKMNSVKGSVVESMYVDNGHLLDDFKGNTEDFRLLCVKITKKVSTGRVTAAGYTGVVAYFCEKFNVPYKVYAGFCLPVDFPRKDKEMEDFNKGKAAGKEHPSMATHIYIVTGDKATGETVYEYYNDRFESEKIDVVEVS